MANKLESIENIVPQVNQDEIPTKRARMALMLKLEAEDGVIVEVEEDVANVSITLRTMIEDLKLEGSEDLRLQDPIPLIITGDMLIKIMEFCNQYRDREYVPKNQRDTNIVKLDDWDKKYMDVSDPFFEQLFNAASYMNIPPLMEILAQKVANTLEDYTVEQLRVAFGVENDFTPQEEADLKKQYSWAETWDFNK